MRVVDPYAATRRWRRTAAATAGVQPRPRATAVQHEIAPPTEIEIACAHGDADLRREPARRLRDRAARPVHVAGRLVVRVRAPRTVVVPVDDGVERGPVIGEDVVTVVTEV